MDVTVTDAQVRSWRLAGYSPERIASACGWTISQTLHRIRLVWQSEYERSLSADPSPDEIKQRCEEIQREWSHRERRKREVGRAAAWRPAVVPDFVLERASS